jgi:nucleoside 2-deoxyribosyltransferase
MKIELLIPKTTSQIEEYVPVSKTWFVKTEDAMKSFYLAGSLRNPRIPEFANQIAAEGYEVFADWFNPGPDADEYHRDYARARGWSYRQFLEGYAAKNIFEFDKFHMDRCDAAVLLMPAGKSGHLELGYTIGRGKPGYLVFEEEPERYEIMVQFATQIFFSRQEFLDFLKEKNNGNVR